MKTTQPDNGRSPKSPQYRWLMILRLVVSLFLFISLGLIRASGNAWGWVEPGLIALGIYSVLAVAYYYLPSEGLAAKFYQGAQVAADLALAICLSVITGGGDSPLSFLFLTAILNSSLVGGIRSAMIVATFSASLWGAMITFQDSGYMDTWLPDLGLLPITGNHLIRILINTGACYLVAGLSGYLAGQLFISRKALVHSQVRLDRLADLNENIIQSIDSGLLTIDQSGLILTVNQAGLEIFGQKKAPDMVGRPWQMFLSQLEHILPLSLMTRPSIFDGGGLRFEYPRESDGEELTLEISIMALMDAGGEIWGRLFVLKDLTNLSQMEETMHKAENLAALGEMAAGLAHEIRTPLASMTGAWHMLKDDALESEDQQRLIAIIGREMERLAKLTNDFLSFARPAQANPHSFDLSPLVADQLKVFSQAGRENLVLETKLEPTPPVYFDPDQLCQIIWNLLSNAVEAGEESAQIKISVETAVDPTRPDYAALRITDNGPGIPHENLTKLFEPFFSTKNTGNGLGLSTVNRILHEGNGHITVNSSHKGSTTFTVLLPLAH